MAIYPSPRHWQLLEIYKRCPPPIDPSQFLQHWDLSYMELGKVAGVSRSTVEHWLSSGSSHREPAEIYCRRLGTIHFIWRHVDRLSPELIRLWCHSPE